MNPLEQSLEKQLEIAEDLLEKRHKEIEKLEDQIEQLESKLEDKDTEIDNLKTEHENEIEILKEELSSDAYDDFQSEYSSPEWEFMSYQKEMVRKAVDYIRTHDTLKGLGQ